MKDPSRYRNKTQVPFGYANGEVVAGFYQKRSHEITNMKSCLIQTDISDQIVDTMRELCRDLNIDPYNESLNLGVLRHVIVRVGFKTGEIMVTLVTRTKTIPNIDTVIETLINKYPQIKSIAQNINPKVTNVIFGDETKILYGEPYIYDEMNGIRFAISPRSFYQVNPVQTETLYSKAVEFAGLTGNEVVFDAYCGIGTITLFLAQHAKEVYGVEIIPEAIEDAKMNAKLNGFDNAQFAVGKSEDIIPMWIKNGITPDVIVVDPPRKGCDKTLLDTMLEAKPERIVYVSCDSSTLARDLRILIDGGYNLEVVQPVDMFPQTAHVETVVLLSKGEIDSKKVRVEFSLEDMDMSDFQDKATYTQIKEYVLEHSGLKVSNLYISQIKRKCGLEVGKNYNLAKSEDSRQPQCPPEKENAIREAMKYFGMI